MIEKFLVAMQNMMEGFEREGGSWQEKSAILIEKAEELGYGTELTELGGWLAVIDEDSEDGE